MLSVVIVLAFCLMVLAPCVVALRGSRLVELGEYDVPVRSIAAKTPVAETIVVLAAEAAPAPEETLEQELEHEMLRAEAAMVSARALMAEAEAAGYEAAAQIAAVRSRMATARAEAARREAAEANAAAATLEHTATDPKEALKPAVPAAA